MWSLLCEGGRRCVPEAGRSAAMAPWLGAAGCTVVPAGAEDRGRRALEALHARLLRRWARRNKSNPEGQ